MYFLSTGESCSPAHIKSAKKLIKLQGQLAEAKAACDYSQASILLGEVRKIENRLSRRFDRHEIAEIAKLDPQKKTCQLQFKVRSSGASH